MRRASVMFERSSSLLGYLLRSRWTGLQIGILGFLLACACAFIAYPHLLQPRGIGFEHDGYNQLAFAIKRYHQFTFSPHLPPTVQRGPGYPAFLASVLMLGENLYPYSVWVAQAVLHGVTCVLLFRMAGMLWDRRRAIWLTLVAAAHPYLLWYTFSVLIESVAVFLFTLMAWTALHFLRRPSLWRSVAAGLVVGAMSLCKLTFLPFAVLLPALLALSNRTVWRQALLIAPVALIVVAPWTLRNYLLTDRFVPVQLLTGFNLQIGDELAQHYFESPLSYTELDRRIDRPIGIDGRPVAPRGRFFWFDPERGVIEDAALMRKSVLRYVNEPLFFVRKIALNAVMFWTLSRSWPVTVATILLQVPLLVLFVLSGWRCVRDSGWFHRQSLLLWLVAAYFLGHLPVCARARYSVVLIPAMLAQIAGLLGSAGPLRSEQTVPIGGELDCGDRDRRS